MYLFVCRCAGNGVLTIYSRAMHSDLLGYEDHVLVITVQRWGTKLPTNQFIVTRVSWAGFKTGTLATTCYLNLQYQCLRPLSHHSWIDLIICYVLQVKQVKSYLKTQTVDKRYSFIHFCGSVLFQLNSCSLSLWLNINELGNEFKLY